jgi:glycosyltransferase involved in cell wall biosynthesis
MAGNSPKVSILLPSLNVRRFLEPRVDSLVDQTFTDWEAIVLDSHSTDGTWEYFESVARIDPRFRLNQVPREGVYAAINRGLELAAGEFVHIATCDDTMAPEFLAQMIDALVGCPEAGVAVCDCLFINQDGNELQPEDMTDRLSKRQIRNLLRSGTVRTSLPSIKLYRINYRPPPHDCLLHFTGRSVYFSLTELLVRTASAKTAGYFETNVGSSADFRWLVRLTSVTGLVHLPKRLATWRFHGDQISLHRDDRRLTRMSEMCQEILPVIRQRHPGLLTPNDCELLLLRYRTSLAKSLIQRVGCWVETLGHLGRMFFGQPLATLQALRRAGFGRNWVFAIILQKAQLVPRDLDIPM